VVSLQRLRFHDLPQDAQQGLNKVLQSLTSHRRDIESIQISITNIKDECDIHVDAIIPDRPLYVVKGGENNGEGGIQEPEDERSR